MNAFRTLTITFVGALVVALGLSASAHAAGKPANWSCPIEQFEDGVCDCGCTGVDVDCPSGTFEICERSGCPTGKVPWEHAPESCMTSTCGDGWHDTGEACDDGERWAEGGCNADCSAVNAGFTCGERAEKCSAVAADEDPAADASDGDAQTGDVGVGPDTTSGPDTSGAEIADAAPKDDVANDGCQAGPGSLVSLAGAFAALLVLARRRLAA